MGVFDSERYQIVALLRSDLYEQKPDDGESLLFENPGFLVRITGTRDDPTVEASYLNGDPLFRLDHATVADIEQMLP